MLKETLWGIRVWRVFKTLPVGFKGTQWEAQAQAYEAAQAAERQAEEAQRQATKEEDCYLRARCS